MSRAYVVCVCVCDWVMVIGWLFAGVCVISADSCVGAVDDGKCSPWVICDWLCGVKQSSWPGFVTPTYTGAGHIIRISSKSWFISVIPFKKWNLYNVYIHSTQTDIFQVFISFNFDDYKWKLMKTPNSVSQKIRILWKGSILKTPGGTL